MDNNTKNNKKWLQIGIVAVIILVIAGIFVLKNFPQVQGEAIIESEQDYPLTITSVNLEKIKSYGIPTVIDFGSDSCGPCREMAPVLETLNAEWQGVAAVQYIDVWKHSDGVSDFPIQVIPTQVFFTAEGKPFVPSDSLAAQLEFTMYSSRETGEHVFTIHQGGLTEEQMRMVFAEMGVDE